MLTPAIVHSKGSYGAGPRTCLDSGFDRTGTSGAEARVLVVDDDAAVRRLTARMLRDEGFIVLEAASAEEALVALKDTSGVRLVLTDVVMPGMDGVQLAQTIQQVYPDQRVMLMSAYVGTGNGTESGGLPIPVLPKPFTRAQLANRIHKILSQH